MRFYIEWHVYESITTPEGIAQMRAAAAPMLKQLTTDERVKYSGHFMGRRGGFFVMEASEEAELMAVLGPLTDYVEFRTFPLIGIEAVLQKIGG